MKDCFVLIRELPTDKDESKIPSSVMPPTVKIKVELRIDDE